MPNFKLLISSTRSFINIANNVGEFVSPCRTPDSTGKKFVYSSLILTHDLVDCNKDFIAKYNFPEIPIFNS